MGEKCRWWLVTFLKSAGAHKLLTGNMWDQILWKHICPIHVYISKKVTLFVCSAVRVFVNQILASFSSLWPAVKPFT